MKSVDVNRKQSKVTVNGKVDAKKVLKEVLSTGKKAEMWPYVRYDMVTYPYAPQAYDKKAPPGFVRNVAQAHGDPKSPEHKLMQLFSDENPHACLIM